MMPSQETTPEVMDPQGPDITMPILGRGSEATVYLDTSDGRAIKHFDRAPVRIARHKARTEFDRLRQAFELSRTSRDVHVPKPGTLQTAMPAFSMERVEGPSLLDMLAKGAIKGAAVDRLAVHVAEGMRLFAPILADCTLDHVHAHPDGGVTFFDFGNGSEDDNGWIPAGPSAAFEELAGSTLYEVSRLGRYHGLAELDEIARFLALVALELDIAWSYRLERRVWHAFAGRGLEGSVFRYLWYRAAGGYNARRMFRIIRSHVPEVRQRSLDTVFSFVWDFPHGDAPVTNGVHKVVDGLMATIGTRGVQAVVLTFGDEPAVYNRGSYTVEVHARKGWRFPSSIQERIQKEGSYAMTVLHGTFNTWNTRLARSLARKGVPYAVNPHTIMDEGFFGVSAFKKNVYWRLFERDALNDASAIISFDERHQDLLAARGVSAPVIVSWNGICDAFIPDNDRFTTEGPVRFHFFGRISTRTKGLDMLLDATARVAREENVEVFIQGPGTADLPELADRAATLGISDRVRFLPPVAHPGPVAVMSEYDVCILPSRYEGFPTALVEALMAARPIVSTRTGSLAPILETEGLATVVDTNSEAIAQGMMAVIRQREEWPEIGRRGRAWALQNLQWDTITGSLLKELESVLNRVH